MLYRLLFLLCMLTTWTSGQKIRDCRSSSECVKHSECAEFKEIRGRSSRDAYRFLRKNLCAIRNGHFMVCCSTARELVLTPRQSKLPRNCGMPFSADKIIFGQQTEPGENPWMATIGFDVAGEDELMFDCGATVIHSRYVLTAAHCVLDKRNKIATTIRLGDWNRTSNPDCQTTYLGMQCQPESIDVAIEKIIRHPQYNNRYIHSDDIALIRLVTPLDFDQESVHPICLPLPGTDPKAAAGGLDPTVIGWGSTENHTNSDILLKAQTTIVDHSVCRSMLSGYGDKQICTLAATETGSCQGDSGGPLMVSGPHGPPLLQIGIVSYGPKPCINHESPSVYTSVSQYIDWINNNIQP